MPPAVAAVAAVALLAFLTVPAATAEVTPVSGLPLVPGGTATFEVSAPPQCLFGVAPPPDPQATLSVEAPEPLQVSGDGTQAVPMDACPNGTPVTWTVSLHLPEDADLASLLEGNATANATVGFVVSYSGIGTASLPPPVEEEAVVAIEAATDSAQQESPAAAAVPALPALLLAGAMVALAALRRR